MSSDVSFVLRYSGSMADQNVIDMYDVSQAIAGFQRTLAITTHLILNGEVITQAPSLQNAQILFPPPEVGSWKAAAIIVPAVAVIASAPADSFPGFMIHSAFNYIMMEATGADIQYENGTLQHQLEEHRTLNDKKIDRSRLDSVVEKCEGSITQMHRPIVKSQTANKAEVDCYLGVSRLPTDAHLNRNTYEYISKTIKSDVRKFYRVKVSSYNINTFMGRFYSPDLGSRTISFTLAEHARSLGSISKITKSLGDNASNQNSDFGFIFIECFRRESVSGRLKSVLVLNILTENEMELLERQLN